MSCGSKMKAWFGISRNDICQCQERCIRTETNTAYYCCGGFGMDFTASSAILSKDVTPAPSRACTAMPCISIARN